MRATPSRHATALLRPGRLYARRGAAPQLPLHPSQPTQTRHYLSATSSTTASSSASASHAPPPSSSSPYSVNATEISHFSALASSWWDPHGPSRPLHLMNPLRHDFIRACLSSSSSTHQQQRQQQTPTKLRYLDVGCGGGIFAESAARLANTAHVRAVDPSEAVLSVARAHARRDPALRGKLEYLCTPIEALPLPDDNNNNNGEYYDVVSLFEVLEHVDYPAEFLSRVARFVRPDGGWLVMSTIARTWTSWVVTNLVAEDLLRVVPRGTHDWAKYVNAHELEAFFAGAEGKGLGRWGTPRVMGVVYVPGFGWREVRGSEKVGNYFFGVQRLG